MVQLLSLIHIYFGERIEQKIFHCEIVVDAGKIAGDNGYLLICLLLFGYFPGIDDNLAVEDFLRRSGDVLFQSGIFEEDDQQPVLAVQLLQISQLAIQAADAGKNWYTAPKDCVC